MIVFLVEHPGREAYIAEKLSRKIAKMFDDDVVILPINFIGFELFFLENVRMVVSPSYNKVINLIHKEIDAPILLLNYEQMLSDINRKIKVISLNYKKGDKYIAWSEEYKNYLIDQGFPETSIILTDRPQNEIASGMFYVPQELEVMLRNSVSNYIESRPVVFIPLTCIQAFKSEAELRRLAQSNPLVTLNDLISRKVHVRETLIKYYQYLAEQKDDVLYIIRPHPSITIDMHMKFINDLGIELPENVLLTGQFSPYQWISRANLLVTNYSSLALDASHLGCQAILVNASNMPQFMLYDWFERFPTLTEFSGILNFVDIRTNNNRAANKNVLFTDAVINGLSSNGHIYSQTFNPRPWRIILNLLNKRLIVNTCRAFIKFLKPSLSSGIYEDYFKKIEIKK